MIDFTPFPKMARWSRDIIITEKIDGTNASVHILPLTTETDGLCRITCGVVYGVAHVMLAASRTRFITTTDDNQGFAKWVQTHADELWALGPGSHFGEWWGGGIQRRYGLAEKRFSLFNVQRWQCGVAGIHVLPEKMQFAPACCHVVPTLYTGSMSEQAILGALSNLSYFGSVAAPGFMDPEGIVLYHTAGNVGFKKTLKDDDKQKGQAR
jgi:hypothetical protein